LREAAGADSSLKGQTDPGALRTGGQVCFVGGCAGVAGSAGTSTPVAVPAGAAVATADPNAQYFVKNYGSLSPEQRTTYWNGLSPDAKASVEKQASANPQMQQAVSVLSAAPAASNAPALQTAPPAAPPAQMTVDVVVHGANGSSKTTSTSSTAPASSSATQ
jgi:hypothetical protein